jgi:hypothetical protein
MKLKGQKRSIKQIVERMGKKGTTLTISEVGAILGGAEAGTITTTEATKEGEVLAAAASVASTVLKAAATSEELDSTPLALQSHLTLAEA